MTIRGVFRVPDDGPVLRRAEDALDLIGEAWGSEVATIAVPAARLDPTFFELRSGLLGEITQTFANYRIRLAIIGDIDEYEASSSAFRDYVREVNSRDDVWFVPDDAALDARLSS